MSIQMRKNCLIRFLALCLIITVLGLLVAIDTPCLFRLLTGIICPTCGMSRAWTSALQLDFSAALAYHPLFWSVGVLAVVFLLDGLLPYPICRRIYVAALLAWVVCYLLRLVLFLSGILDI